MEKKILILGIDRDNDIGEKTTIPGPLLGRQALVDTSLALGIADPTESDTNVLFHCIKLYDELKREGKDVYVAAATGDKLVGYKSDMIISGQLDTIKEKYGTDSVILVSDGKEDENVLPIIQSKMDVMSIERVTVQQSEGLEDTYFILHRYIKKMMEDRKISGLFLGIPGIILIIYAFTNLFPAFTKYGWFATFLVAGSYLFSKGFGLDYYFQGKITPKRVKATAYTLALVIAAYGAFLGFENIRWSMVPYINLESVRYLITVFFDGSFPLLYIGIIAALAGNVISAYTNQNKRLWTHLAILIMGCSIFGIFYQYSSYTQNEITRNEMVFSALAISFTALIGLAFCVLQRSKTLKEKTMSHFPLSRKGVVTILAAALVISSAVYYSQDSTTVDPITDASFPITMNMADQLEPGYGTTTGGRDYVVWQDNRNGNWDIYVQYLDTNETINITADPYDQKNPRVWGDRVVWEDYRNGNWDIYLYYVSTEVLRQVTDNLYNQINPDIFEDRIVWEDERNGNADIYLYSIISREEQRISSDQQGMQPFQTTPSIYGTTIIWLDNRFGEFNIFSYDAATGNEKSLTSGRSIKFNPRMYENVIVWEDNRNGNWDIYMYDTDTDTETQVTSDPSNQVNASLTGTYIVWEDDRNGNKDIYLSYIGSSTVINVTDNPSDQENPYACESMVLWIDWKNDLDGMETYVDEDNPDIYAISLSAVAP